MTNIGEDMKTKTYKHGKHSLKIYQKSVGHGWEVGLKTGSKTLFVGNFVHSKEATQWFATLNKEIPTFANHYWVGPKCSFDWYSKFLANHIGQKYYGFVNKILSKHQRDFDKAFKKDERKYKTLRKAWDKTEQITLKRAS